MGPGSALVNGKTTALPSRPKFSWDIKPVPWTDGRGPQEGYAESVELWCAFHDMLDESNPNRIPPRLRGTILRSQLYGRARDQARSVDADTIKSADGATAIVCAVYRRDPLSVVSEVYSDFLALRGINESFKVFETRFDALVSKFGSHGDEIDFPEPLIALQFLNAANVDDMQRVSILAACISKMSVLGSTDSKTKNAVFIQNIPFDSIADVLRQCDATDADRSLGASTANAYKKGSQQGGSSRKHWSDKRYHLPRSSRCNRNRRNKSSPKEIAMMKAETPCHSCQQFSHWSDAHNDDGSLKPGVLSHKSSSEAKTALFLSSEKTSKSSNSSNVPVICFTASVSPNSVENLLGSATGPSTDVLGLSSQAVSFAAETSEFANGALVDDGAPYSAIGETELFAYLRRLVSGDVMLSKIPDELNRREYWQYGNGSHASERRKILGAGTTHLRTDQGSAVLIRHLVIEGSSQWVLGRNLTQKCDPSHINDHALIVPLSPKESISLVDYNRHSYVRLSRLFPPQQEVTTNICVQAATTTSISSPDLPDCNVRFKSWKDVRRLVDRVHCHVCGHATFYDIKTLLRRTNLWNDQVQNYLSFVISNCTSCRASAVRPPNRRVSISSLNHTFNDIVTIDHMFMGNATLLHVMDVATRFSAAHVVSSTNLEEVITGFESCWLAHFWPPSSIQSDAAFEKLLFTNFVENFFGAHFRLIPPRRHQKNPIEPRHGVIRSIFLRLKHDNPEVRDGLNGLRATRISNDLYGSEVMSAFEATKGFPRPPVAGPKPSPIPDDVVKAQKELAARRKLTRILRSKTFSPSEFRVGELVQVYVRHANQKRGKWLSPRQVIDVDTTAGIITVPGLAGKKVMAVVEDTRAAFPISDFSEFVISAVEELDDLLEFELDQFISRNESTNHERNASGDRQATHDDEFGDVSKRNSNTSSTFPDSSVGDRIEVFWPLDGVFYAGKGTEITNDGKHVITYYDTEVETLNMSEQSWRPISNSTMQGNAVLLQLKSNNSSSLKELYTAFGNKTFMWQHAQAFQQHTLQLAYKKEEELFLQSVKRVSRNSVPSDANVISSHVLYKVKVSDDGSLSLKARIAPHGNEDSINLEMRSDCCMCPPTEIRIILSIAAVKKWRIVKIDVKSAFLQSGPAQRDVYVIPPRESSYKNALWLLLAAAYGLVNSNAKWQVESDSALHAFGLKQLPEVSQLFFKMVDGTNTNLIVIKIVDDLLAAGTDDALRAFSIEFGKNVHLVQFHTDPASSVFSV